MSWRIFIAILRKDVLSLVWLVLLATLLFALDVVLLRLELMPTWVMFRIPLLLLTATVLILSVLQLDSPVSLVDDWLCRPVPRRELVAAKLFLLFAVFYLPRAAASFLVDLSLGCPLAEALQDALLLQETFFLLLLPVLLMTAVTSGLLWFARRKGAE